MSELEELVKRLPEGVRSRMISGINGLTMHVLEAGFEQPGRSALILLHGFPELAFSWRYLLPLLAAAGHHVIAPDQRGYGATSGWRDGYDTDLTPYLLPNLASDVAGLCAALDLESVTVVGHDFGSPVAGWCGLMYPQLFQRVVLMSAPFPGPPEDREAGARRGSGLAEALAHLPRPRKHYQHYYCTEAANSDLLSAPQGVHDFLRAYYHVKSADWAGNDPHPLEDGAAASLARMPGYYVMNLDETMPETVAPYLPGQAEIQGNRWLPEADLRIYSTWFERTGFQGGLNWYRATATGGSELRAWSGKTLDQPALFLSGAADWGTYQSPGALARMGQRACTDFRGVHLVPGAGHWVQQEQPDATVRLVLDFLAS